MAGLLRDGSYARYDRSHRRPTCDADAPYGQCRRPAGYGTDHVGWGPCKNHFGNTPHVRKRMKIARAHDMANDAVQILGLPVVTTAEDALIGELHRSQGEVIWQESQIQDWETTPEGRVKVRSFDPKTGEHVIQEITVLDAIAKHPAYAAYREARTHLAKVAKMILDAGVAERQVQAREAELRILAGVVNAAIANAGLGPVEQAALRSALRREIEATPALVG